MLCISKFLLAFATVIAGSRISSVHLHMLVLWKKKIKFHISDPACIALYSYWILKKMFVFFKKNAYLNTVITL